MRTFKTAVIGAGFAGRNHIEGIRRMGNIELRAVVVSPNADTKKISQDLGVTRVITDAREVLSDPEIETVHIATPNKLHLPLAKAALEAGKHVVCEKPLTTSAADARTLVE